ncbi:hypothetical protein G6F53_014071 [Rhizopus delemar]|nr:hypothetical protein G6F53_014071 [Rhizopus delemar]
MDVPAQDQVDARLGPGRQRALAPDQQIGEIGFDLGAHRVVRHHDPQLARAGLAQALGHALAGFDLALRGFEHPTADHTLLWDLQHAEQVADLLAGIEDADQRALAERTLARSSTMI